MVRYSSQCAFVLLTLLMVLPLLVVYAFSVSYNTTRAPSPVPNGYEDLLKAAQQVSPRGLNVMTLSVDEAEDIVMRNQRAIKRARLGLTRECRVVPDWDGTIRFKELGALFLLEAGLAELHGRTDEALESYTDAIHIASAMETDGLTLHPLLARAFAVAAGRDLLRLQEELTTEQRRRALAILLAYQGELRMWTPSLPVTGFGNSIPSNGAVVWH